MSVRIRPALWLAIAAITIGALYFIGRSNRRSPPIAPLRDSLYVLRVAADSCRADLDEGSALLQSYDARLDSLRARVRAFEDMDARGVPVDSYAVYLGAFEEYNDSAAGWSLHADTLRTRLQRCRRVTQTHNLIADSLRRLLVRTR